jgi:hypothetical protein
MISNRNARWVLQLQEYDIEISHISGTQNYLADTISRKPAEMTLEKNEALNKTQRHNGCNNKA